MRKLITLLILTLAPAVALSADEVVKVGNGGTLLDDVALNAGAASLTFYIGPRVKDATPTSSTSSTSGSDLKAFDAIKLEINYDYGATTVALTLTCTEGQTKAAATGKITTATYSGGTYTLEDAGVITTPSMAADTIYPVKFRTRNATVIKCILSSSGSPGATDKVTVTGWAVKRGGS